MQGNQLLTFAILIIAGIIWLLYLAYKCYKTKE